MTLRHWPVVIGGERVGDLVSLEQKVVFYTTVPALAHLGGTIFGSPAEAMAEIRNATTPEKTA